MAVVWTSARNWPVSGARIKAADFAIYHLETTLAPAGALRNSVFARLRNSRKRSKTGYDACSTVSNHTLDRDYAVKQTWMDWTR